MDVEVERARFTQCSLTAGKLELDSLPYPETFNSVLVTNRAKSTSKQMMSATVSNIVLVFFYFCIFIFMRRHIEAIVIF